MKRACLVWIGVALAGCGAPSAEGRGAGGPNVSGPNYSTIPCNDNCGGDPQCLSHCTDTSTPGALPPPALLHK